MYRGTLCEVQERAYLICRLNGEKIPEVIKAETAEKKLLEAILGMVKLLNPKDFELLIDLIFSASGWRRQAITGKSTKTVDLDLVLPSTGERALVQVKSSTCSNEYQAYEDVFSSNDAYDRMFYVWHSGKLDKESVGKYTFWGSDAVAEHTLNAGLLSWLKDKVS